MAAKGKKGEVVLTGKEILEERNYLRFMGGLEEEGEWRNKNKIRRKNEQVVRVCGGGVKQKKKPTQTNKITDWSIDG